MRAKGHSLWLMPTGETYDKFSNLIKKLAGEYKAPVFIPHITLLGEAMQSAEDILQLTEQLASGQKPFSVILNRVDYQDFYFRALFIKAKITDPLQTFYDHAKKVFGMQDIPNYMPHLSVMYGNFPQAVKEQIIQAIGRNQTTEFIVNSVHLFKTDGEANNWHRVKEIQFT